MYNGIKKNNMVFSSISTIKIDLLLILFSLIQRRAKFIISFRKPLYSEKLFSFYNLKYRFSILLFSIFKKRFIIHTISSHAKKYLENFYKPNRVHHIIHGVDLDNYREKQVEKNHGILNFIYVGNLDDIHKGVGVMLDGIDKFIKENKELKVFFEFCGRGPLESRIKELQEKFPSIVKYNGYISNNKISEYYKRNDVFLFTSRREPFGRVIIEALASKLIIICTKTYGSIEILKKKEFAFFLNKLNTLEIENKINEVYELWRKKPQKFNDLKEAAKRYAIEKYDHSHELKGFIKLINSII
jgi:glycosyltransferase involved in cell wall biosynthesis